MGPGGCCGRRRPCAPSRGRPAQAGDPLLGVDFRDSGVDGVEQRPCHAAPSGVVDVGVVLARPAVLDELFHAAQGAHGVARGPEGRARVPRRTALAVEHVWDGVHRFESGVGLHRTVADAQHEHRRPREALADIGDHLLDLSGVVGVVLHARLHDVQPVLEHHQIVAQHGVDLGVDRRVGPEHRLPVVAAHGVVVDHDAPAFENRSVADEVLRAGEHLEGERADTGGRDGDLPHGVIARDVEFAALGVVERHLDAAVAGREEEDARRGARIEAFAVVGALPAGRSPGRRLAHPARDVEILAQARGRGFALHDVVGRPALRLGFDRAPERRQRRGHRGESRAAARVGRLEPFAQVGREDVALDERVAQEGDAHRARSVEQRVAEGLDASAVAEILDRGQRRDEARRVGHGAFAAGRVLREEPFVGDLHLARGGVGLDAFGDGGHVDMELLFVEERRLGGGFGRFGVVERKEVREDVGAAEFHAPDALRRDETYGHEHCDERCGRQPAVVGVIFSGGVHRWVSRAVRGSGRRSKAPTRWRSTPLRGKCGPPTRGPLWPARAVLPASCGWSGATPRRGPRRCTRRAA